MCGISGLVVKSGKVGHYHHDLSQQMLLSQHMRGPDENARWFGHDVILGHNRLAILDPTNGAQPMENARWVLTYNGEIYNHMELRSLLSNKSWMGHSDTESLLWMIDEWGVEHTLSRVEGMFAFAAYDRVNEVLWLAVDPMGIKPLYYHFNDDLFAFASSPAALTHCKDRWPLNHSALIDYLALGATRESLFQGIMKVHPGHVIRRQKDGVTGTMRYLLRYTDQTDVNPEYVLDRVQRSVRISKMSDVPVVMFLSGGIDSTVVASQCVGMDAIHLDGPEVSYARMAALFYGNKLDVVQPRQFVARECLEDYARQSGDCSASAIVPYIVSKEVAKKAKCAISSNGADELFFGYDRISEDFSTDYQMFHIFRESLLVHPDCNWKQTLDAREQELDTYVQYDLNKTLDFASMCHGLEVRVPYLNRSVVEAALALPREKHVIGKYTKAILKDFLQSEGFSKEFVNRPKLGFSLFSEPEGYYALQTAGLQFLANEFAIDPVLHTKRDEKYYANAAAAFLCWWRVWSHKIL